MSHEPPAPHNTQDYLQHVVRSIPAAVIATDRALDIRFHNQKARKLFASVPGEDLSGSVVERMPADRRGVVEQILRQCLVTGRTSEFRIRLRRDGAKPQYLSVTASPLSHIVPPPGVVLWIVDNTRRVEFDKKLHKAERLKSLVTLAGAFAHQFNNILGSVLTSVDHALVSDPPGPIRKSLQRASTAIGQATAITNKLLAFAEMDRRGESTTDLRLVIEEFVTKHASRLRARNITLELHVESTLPPHAVDGRRFTMVLEELLSNAVDAMPEGGLVQLWVQQERDAILISFVDHGRGIPEHVQDKLFEPFVTTKGLLGEGQGDNIGLGLSVVYGIITEMGGALSVASVEGQGTRVDIRLLMKPDDELTLESTGDLPPIKPAPWPDPQTETLSLSDSTESLSGIIRAIAPMPVPNVSATPPRQPDKPERDE